VAGGERFGSVAMDVMRLIAHNTQYTTLDTQHADIASHCKHGLLVGTCSLCLGYRQSNRGKEIVGDMEYLTMKKWTGRQILFSRGATVDENDE